MVNQSRNILLFILLYHLQWTLVHAPILIKATLAFQKREDSYMNNHKLETLLVNLRYRSNIGDVSFFFYSILNFVP
jgi:hypothetical protein